MMGIWTVEASDQDLEAAAKKTKKKEVGWGFGQWKQVIRIWRRQADQEEGGVGKSNIIRNYELLYNILESTLMKVQSTHS
jgi:hypothetical protein